MHCIPIGRPVINFFMARGSGVHCVSILKEVVYTVVQWGNRECALYSYWERRSAYCFPIGLD